MVKHRGNLSLLSLTKIHNNLVMLYELVICYIWKFLLQFLLCNDISFNIRYRVVYELQFQLKYRNYRETSDLAKPISLYFGCM
jgi:hypothetical protein